MKKVLFIVLCLASLSSMAQSILKTTETFLGVPVLKHHTIINPGDSIVLPSNAYIIEVIMIDHGDYVVYNNDAPFVYPDIPGVDHITHREEGSFEIDGQVQAKTFEPEGNEKYADQAIVSRKARFHLYYFTLAEKRKLNLKIEEDSEENPQR